jgi:uncharacterized protein
MFGRLLPREGRFFDLFNESVDLIAKAAEEFQLMLGDLAHSDSHSRAIKALEHQADNVTHKTVELLHMTFITPLDRDEIHTLITRLDDILDFLDAAAARIHLYKLREVPPEALQLAAICVKSTHAVRTAVKGLDDLKDIAAINQLCVEINRLENDADHVLRSATARLFEHENDVKRLIMYKEILELLETVTDRCEDVANVVQGITLENS